MQRNNGLIKVYVNKAKTKIVQIIAFSDKNVTFLERNTTIYAI